MLLNDLHDLYCIIKCHLICRQGKVVLYELKNYKKSLEEVMEYNHHPLPAICAQAVHVVCWFYLIVGAVSSQPWCYGNDYDSVWYYLQVYTIEVYRA